MKPICVVSCPIDTFSGYGARSRDFVNDLIKTKDKEWDIKIMPQKWGDTPQNFLPKTDPLRDRFIYTLSSKPNIWFQITIPNEFSPIGDYNVGVTAGIESTIFPADFIEGMNRMDLNLVSSIHSKNISSNSTWEKKDQKTNQLIGHIKLEKPCEVLFEGLNLDIFHKNPNKTEILKDIPEDFCFLFTGHWLQGDFGEDRKNIATLIKTFLETFNSSSNKKPALVLKTNMVNYSILDKEHIIQYIQRIKKLVSGKLPNIYLLHGELTDKEMNSLNNDPKIKSFVNFTHGEGFGRPLLEGAITGKPAIVSNWSGHIDFIKPEYNVLVGGELKNIHPSAANKWLLKESQWFKINTEVASKAMKDIFKHYKKYFKDSRKQTQYIKDNWSFEKMAQKLNELLPNDIKATPQHVGLQLPKLKKLEKKSKTPKLKLPKLKKLTV